MNDDRFASGEQPSRRRFFGLIGAITVIPVAGCMGDDNGGNGSTPEPRPNFYTDEHPEFGQIIVDNDGYVVYMFDSDEQGAGESTCYSDCADAWPPLILDEEPIGDRSVGAEMTLFEREDGSTQVAVNGWPLYYYSGDVDPGQANGQGVNGNWWVLRPGGNPYRGEDNGNGNGPGY